MKTLAFVTGASRGLGEAIAGELIARGTDTLVGISRSRNEALENAARQADCTLEWIQADLSRLDTIPSISSKAFSGRDPASWDRIVLINNAGVVDPVARVGTASNDALIRNVHVNTVAPLCLANSFVHAFDGAPGRRVIINITSGLAKRPMAGVSAYCVTKAGLDMLTACIAVEQEGKENPVEVYGSSPGTVQTDMQRTLRGSSPEDLPDRDHFAGLYERGELLSAEFSARKTVDMLDIPGLESGEVYRTTQL
ncbi:MAG: SDR family NAD(P)-dependent oxidoreductase [Spirochaetia bacterium]